MLCNPWQSRFNEVFTGTKPVKTMIERGSVSDDEESPYGGIVENLIN